MKTPKIQFPPFSTASYQWKLFSSPFLTAVILFILPVCLVRADGELGTSALHDVAAEDSAVKSASAIEAAMAADDHGQVIALLARQPSGSAAVQKLLLAACRRGDARLVAAALAPGADGNAGGGALVASAKQKSLECVELILTYGADVSMAPAALKQAVRHGNEKLAARLLQAGADPNVPAVEGVSPLTAVLPAGNLTLARRMFEHGGYPYDFIEPAMAKGDATLLDSLFQYGLSPDRKDAAGNPLLVRAALDVNGTLAKLLVAKGADAKAPGAEGQTALHFVVVAKNEPMVRLLLEGGCDPNHSFVSPVKEEFLQRIEDESFQRWLKKDSGLTPLMIAAARGDTGMIKLLLEKGARRGLQTKSRKRFPVVFACDKEHIPAAQLLLGRNPALEKAVYRVTISLSKQRAMLYKNDELVRTSRVSTGRKGCATPTGKFVITDKQRNWVSTIYKVSMPFFMRLNCSEIGLHAGNCPGYPASHGCVRMPRADVQFFFSHLKIGDAVTIED